MSKRFVILVTRFLVLIPLRMCTPLLAQDNYFFSHLDFSDGLINNTVYDLHLDREGYLWIGSGPELQRFDGSNFLNFTHSEEGNSIPFGDVRALHHSRNGDLWVGTDGGGLVKYADGFFYKIYPDTQEHIPFNAIEQILELPSGELYIASWDGGILKIDPEGTKSRILHDAHSIHSIPSNQVVALHYDPLADRVWVGTWGSGLAYIEGSKVTRVNFDEEGYNSPNARVITQTSDGSLWVGSWGQGLYQYNNGKFRLYSTLTGDLEDDKVLTLTTQGDKLWIGTWGGGLTLYQYGQFRTFRKEDRVNSLSSDFIETVIASGSDQVIIGTYGGGINFLSESQFTYYDFQQLGYDPTYNFINSIAEDQNGKIWIGTDAGILIETDSVFSPFESVYTSDYEINPVYKLFPEENGDIWIGGSTDVGLYKLSQGKIEDYSQFGGVDFSEYFIFDILRSSDASLWICANVNAGLIRIVGDEVERYDFSSADDSSRNVVNFCTAVEVQPGEIWFGSNRNGLLHLKDTVFTHYGHEDSEVNSLSSNYAFHLLNATSGDLWVGTEYGLNRLRDKSKTFDRFFTSDGLLNNNISSLVEGENGDIWIGSDRGLSQLRSTDLSIQNFDQLHGLQGYPFNNRAVFRSRLSGKIFIGGVDGLTVFHPDSINDQFMQSAKITGFSVSDTSLMPKMMRNDYTLSSVLQLQGRDLNIQFSSMDLAGQNEYYFQYRLVDIDSTWIDNDNSSNVAFAQLPSGRHIFEVRASLSRMNWSEPDSLSFVVPYSWWESWWFRVLVVCSIALLVFLILKVRIKLLERQRAQLTRQVENKTAALESKTEQIQRQASILEQRNEELSTAVDELSKLKAQQETFQKHERAAIRREIHDNISTTLFAIRLMIKGKLKGITEENSQQVSREIDGMLGGVLNDSRIIMQNLESEETKHISFYDSVYELVDSLNALDGPEIQVNWTGKQQIADLRLASNLLRMIHEVLSNTFLHAKARRIMMEFNNSERVSWTILDDGVGFDISRDEQSVIYRIKKRADQINGVVHFSSDPVSGTRVTFHCDPQEIDQ